MKHKPLFLIGCPPCIACCSWNRNLNWTYMEQTVYMEKVREAVSHLEGVAELYQIQIDGKR